MTATALSAMRAGGVKAEENQGAKPPKQDPLTQKDTFLQLLVAQIRNQDPLKPTDGVEFLSQLAQFSSLEQSIQLKDEVASVRKAVENLTETVKGSTTNTSGAN